MIASSFAGTCGLGVLIVDSGLFADAEQFVTGMQGDQSSGYLKVSACLKHYAA